MRFVVLVQLITGVAMLGGPVLADPTSNSARFTLLPAEPGAGGGRVANGGATITADISVGDAIEGGVTNVTTTGAQANGGYTGQLYDARSLAVAADPAVVIEKSSTQLTAVATMDDDTLVSVGGADAAWSILDGPLTGIDGVGLVSVGEVFVNGPAGVRGTYDGVDGDLLFTVLNVNLETPISPQPETTLLADIFDFSQAGLYQGILADGSGALVGAMQGLRLSPTGAISGRVIFNGRIYRLRGALEPDGTYTGEIVRRNEDPLAVTLAIGRTENGAGGLTLRATISGDGTNAGGSIAQAPYHRRNNPSPVELVRGYTFLIPSPESTADPALPAGDGYGWATVTSSGGIIARGKTGDGTPFTTRGYLTEDGQWHLYQPLYGGRGMIAGVVSFRDVPAVSDLDGALDWVKNPNPRDRRYPDGFDLPSWLVGSNFDPPARGERALDELADQHYNARLTLAGNPLPDDGFARVVSWLNTNALVHYGPERLSARANPRNGLISGSYFDPATRTRFGFGGVVLQKQGLGGGNFVLANEAGYLLVEPGTDFPYPGSEDAGPFELTTLPGGPATDPNLTNLTAFDPAAAGFFNGTLVVDGSGECFGGLQSVKLSPTGAISGQIWIEGMLSTFRGLVDETGEARITVARRGLDPVEMTLQLALADGTTDGFALVGTVDIDGNPHSLDAQRRPTFTRTLPAAEEGKYTLAMRAPDATDPALVPGGDGYGSISVLFNGLSRGLMFLADGTRASMSGHLSRSGEWSVYRSLYGQRGYLAGKLSFRDVAGVSDVDGDCRWFKQDAVPRTPNYADGFDVTRTVIGGSYTPPAAGEAAFPLLDDAFHNAWMRLEGPDLSPSTPTDMVSLDRAVTWNSANRILYYGPDKALIQFNRNTGLATGRYQDRDKGVNVPFGGALLQEQALLTGSYLSGGQSGNFSIAPRNPQ